MFPLILIQSFFEVAYNTLVKKVLPCFPWIWTDCVLVCMGIGMCMPLYMCLYARFFPQLVTNSSFLSDKGLNNGFLFGFCSFNSSSQWPNFKCSDKPLQSLSKNLHMGVGNSFLSQTECSYLLYLNSKVLLLQRPRIEYLDLIFFTI